MKTTGGILISFLLILISVPPAEAGYRQLQKQFDSYSPPIYGTYKNGVPDRTQKPGNDEDFAGQREKLEQMKKRWEQLLEDRRGTRPPDAESDLAAAKADLAKSFSLRPLEVLVLQGNKNIRAAQNRLRAAIEAFSQVSNLDEILRQYGAFTEDLMIGVGPMKTEEPVGMKFPYPGVLSLKGQVVEQEVKMASEALGIARREALNQARKTYWNLVFNLQAQRITRETVKLLDSLEQVASTRYESGRTSFQDVLKIRINRATIAEDLISLGRERGSLDMKIRELADLSRDTPIGSPIKGRLNFRAPDLDTLYAAALEHREEIRQLRANIGKMDRMIEMAETMILPSYSLDFSLYADKAVNMVGNGGKDSFSTTTRASRGAGIPKMPWYGAEDAYLRQTRLRRDAMKNALGNLESQTLTMVQNSWLALDRAIREYRVYANTVVKLSRSAVDTSNQGYEAGKVTFADVIDSFKTWLNAGMASERKYADVGISWANLEAMVGKPILPEKNENREE